MCLSAKNKRTCEMVFEQLQAIRSKFAQSKRELDEIHTVSTFLKFVPEKVELLLNNQHSWSPQNIKYDDGPLFNGDSYVEVKLWLDNKTSEQQETHVPISDTSKLNTNFNDFV